MSEDKKNMSLIDKIVFNTKVLIWPLLVIVFYSINYSEINTVFKILPKVLESSSKITVGDFVFEIEKSAKEKEQGYIFSILETLTPNEIKLILKTGDSGVRLFSVRTEDSTLSIEKGHLELIRSLSKIGLVSLSLSDREERDRFFNNFDNKVTTEKLNTILDNLDRTDIHNLELKGYKYIAKDLNLKLSMKILDLIDNYLINKTIKEATFGSVTNIHLFKDTKGEMSEVTYRLSKEGKEIYNLLVNTVSKQFKVKSK